MIVQYIVRIVLLATIGDEEVFGYIELSTCFYIASFIISAFIIYMERSWTFLSRHARGHGTIVLLFWSAAFLHENLAFISWQSPYWWWKLDTKTHEIEFGLWVSRYVLTLLLFGIGLWAPGLPRKSLYAACQWRRWWTKSGELHNLQTCTNFRKKKRKEKKRMGF